MHGLCIIILMADSLKKINSVSLEKQKNQVTPNFFYFLYVLYETCKAIFEVGHWAFFCMKIFVCVYTTSLV